MDVCRVNGCENPQQARGVCIAHLKVITAQVDTKQATWKQYEEAGVCIPIPAKRDRYLCFTPMCMGKSRSRGLCNSCYAAASRIMKKKNLQWHDLEQLGLARPARTLGFVKQSYFQEAAKKAIAKAEEKYGTVIAPAPPEVSVPVTQAEPLAKDQSLWDDKQIESMLPTAPMAPAPATEPPLEPSPPLMGLPPNLEVQSETPPETPEVTLHGVPIVYDPNLGQQSAEPPAPATEPEPAVVDLTRINAPDPEPEPQEPNEEQKSFPAPPTQFPGVSE